MKVETFPKKPRVLREVKKVYLIIFSQILWIVCYTVLVKLIKYIFYMIIESFCMDHAFLRIHNNYKLKKKKFPLDLSHVYPAK